MKRRSAMIACVALAGMAAISGAGLAQQGQGPRPEINVNNSPNSVAAGNINAVNTDSLNVGHVNVLRVYELARRDSVTEQFVTTLSSYNRFLTGMSVQLQLVPFYTVAIEGAMPRPPNDEPDSLYLIVAGTFDATETLGPRVARCEVREGVFVVAGMIRSVGTGASGRTRGRILTTEDNWPVLNQVCAMLRRPASGIDASSDNSEPLVFDLAAGDVGFVALVLMPDQGGEGLEREAISHYWASALSARYVRAPRPTIGLQMRMGGQLRALGAGRWAELPFALPINLIPPPYPQQAHSEFGPHIQRLERDWNDYLNGAAMTFGNERRPVLSGGRWSRLVRRFRVDELGSAEFWDRAGDLRSFAGQLNCLGSHFLVDRGYIPPDSNAVPGQCPLDEIRLSPRP